MTLIDRFGRPLRSLRISVTDRCNLRCQYCMPEPEYVWLPRENILSFEEIGTLVDAFSREGVDRVRITGGEPLLRRDLPVLVESLAARPRITDLALTTNGVLLRTAATALKRAGLHRITISLDTLRRDRFRALTGSSDFDAVVAGIHAAADAGFDALKLDTVVIRGTNDDELIPLLEFARTTGAEIRFIEYMDVGGATRWSPAAVVPRAEMLEVIGRHFGGVTPVQERSSAPAERFVLPDGTLVRHHRLDDDPVLRDLRPRAAHSRRRLAALPLRDGRHRPAPSAARRRLTGGVAPAHSRRLVPARRPRR